MAATLVYAWMSLNSAACRPPHLPARSDIGKCPGNLRSFPATALHDGAEIRSRMSGGSMVSSFVTGARSRHGRALRDRTLQLRGARLQRDRTRHADIHESAAWQQLRHAPRPEPVAGCGEMPTRPTHLSSVADRRRCRGCRWGHATTWTRPAARGAAVVARAGGPEHAARTRSVRNK